MNKEEPKVLTRMRLSCCWGDNLNEKELNEVVDYINWLQAKVNQLEINRDEAIKYIKSNPNVFYGEYLIDVETLLENECTDEIAGEIRFISTLLEILERGKE